MSEMCDAKGLEINNLQFKVILYLKLCIVMC